jgi:acetylornithine/N-succinyldiaminopimelate aminotransferase
VIPAVLPTYARYDVVFEKGEGAYLTATDGRRYLDFASGIAVTVLGHSHPHLVAALIEQGQKLWHVSNLFRIAGQERLAERLVANCFADSVFFGNSGAEAMELAIKMVRRHHYENGHPEKHRIIACNGSFHGRTLATLAAGWSAAKREPFEPVPAGFQHVPRNDLAALAAAVGPETCAVLVEPIQGEGGVWSIDVVWLELARELCDRYGALLLYDEVQTGIGRCGAWFCGELTGVRADAVAVAKGLAGGLPIGALLATDQPDAGFERGDHATTFGGSPPIAAAALAVLAAIEREGLVENARAVGDHIAARASALPGVDHVRGAGLLLGIELSDAPAAEVSDALRTRGILVNAITPTALRLVPPLCLSAGEADRFCAAFEAVLTARSGQHATTVA